jgi:hypothetical protein
VERVEYVHEGIRSFEAVENDISGVAQDPILRQNILRLAVSTIFNSLHHVIEGAKQYAYAYDFLRQNQPVLDRIFSTVFEDLSLRSRGREITGVYGEDPFAYYKYVDRESDIISRQDAVQSFNNSADLYEKWKSERTVIAMVWETYFGTQHELTRKSPDVSFLQNTARSEIIECAGGVVLKRGLVDQWGVSLDPAVQKKHEEKNYVEAGV